MINPITISLEESLKMINKEIALKQNQLAQLLKQQTILKKKLGAELNRGPS